MSRNYFAALLTLVLLSFSYVAAQKEAGSGEIRRLVAQLPKVIEPGFGKQTFDVRDFGAKGDGLTLNTKAIGDAIEAAHKSGGTVLIPAGIWLTGPIVLKSNVRLHLEKNAIVAFSRNRADFPLIETTFEGVAAFRAQAPLSAVRAENIAITGEGIFDGGGDAWRPVKKGKMIESDWKKLVASGGTLTADGGTWYPSESALKGSQTKDAGKMQPGKTRADFEAVRDFLRPNMLQISDSRRILVEGVTFQNSPAWTMHFVLSENITIRGVNVKNPWYGQNNDAVDLESSRNVLLEDCVFDTGDDAITLKSGRDEEGRKRNVPTENVVARNMTVYRAHGGFVIGSEMSGGVRNVFVLDSKFIGTDIGLRFKTQRGRGGLVEKVYAENIVMKDIGGDAILFDMYYGGKSRPGEKFAVSESTPRFQDFLIKDVVVEGASRGIFLRGLPEMNVRNVRMENLLIQADRGMYSEETDGVAVKNLTLLAKDAGPLIDVLSSRRLLFDNLKYKPGAELLINLSGGTRDDVRLLNTDVSSAKKDFQIVPDNPAALNNKD